MNLQKLSNRLLAFKGMLTATTAILLPFFIKDSGIEGSFSHFQDTHFAYEFTRKAIELLPKEELAIIVKETEKSITVLLDQAIKEKCDISKIIINQVREKQNKHREN